MLGKMMNTPLLVSDLITHAAKFHGDTPVISVNNDKSVIETDWHGIHQGSKKLANALSKLSLKSGDRLATIAWSNHRHLQCWYAISGSGMVCHTINPRLFPEQLIYIINDADDKVIFFEDTFIDLVNAIKPQLPSVQKFVCLSAKNDAILDKMPDVVFFDDLVADESDEFDWPILDENQPSSLCYTSGTTGNPKGVLYNNRTTIVHTLAICLPDALGISAKDVVLPVAPMFHANSWGLPYATALTGASLVLPGPHLDGDSLVDLIDGRKVTLALGVPTIWTGLIDAARRKGSKLETMKRNGVGGTPCSETLYRTLRDEFDSDTIHAWGMTEMSPLGTMNHIPKPKLAGLDDDDMVKLRLTQGRPSFGVDLRIVDSEGSGEILPHDGKAQGNLQTRGYWIVDTYFGKDESALEDDGWFDTGDIASIDPDGYLTIRDRAKDLIKSGGEWISSVELEGIAQLNDDVESAVAIGAYHPKWDERPLMIIVAKKDKTIDKQELLKIYRNHVASWQVPDDIIFVDSVPITGTGKIDKKVIREEYKNYLVDQGLTEQ